MRNYLNYSVSELAQDDDFMAWVKYPGRSVENDRFWAEWVRQYPHKAADVEEARNLILAVIAEGDAMLDFSSEENILRRIKNSVHAENEDTPSVPITRKKYYYSMAAAIAVFIIAGGLAWWKLGVTSGPSNVAYPAEDFIKEINNGTKPKTIVFEDGTSIVLQPRSSVQYPEVFANDRREVRISGEAFFEVEKDVNRPFVVYADALVTKVLGTSFLIRAYQHEPTLTVRVSTGKVSVFTEADLQTNINNGNKLEGVLLTPNQQIVFQKDEQKITKSLVDNPEVLRGMEATTFEFKDVPLRDVFGQLEQAYGIEIVFDDDVLGGCKLNASLGALPLFDKMRLICKGVNADFQILDSRIVITGKGCKDWQ